MPYLKTFAGTDYGMRKVFFKTWPYCDFVLGGNVDEYAKHLFRVLDTDKDGLVSFSEAVVGFHNLSGNGDEQEKIKMVFQVRGH